MLHRFREWLCPHDHKPVKRRKKSKPPAVGLFGGPVRKGMTFMEFIDKEYGRKGGEK